MEFTKDINFSNILRGNKISEITYSGDLYKKGSESLTIVYGFGENWDHTTEQEMSKTENGFSAKIEMKNNFDTFNFCFRNNNYEWDNNQSFNYISAIQPAILEIEKTEELDFSNEVENSVDVNLIMEILDHILEENFNNIENVSTESEEKQQILEEILAESETESIVSAPVLMEEFNMDELVENILNPVINFETEQQEDFEDVIKFADIDTTIQDYLKQGLENSISNIGTASLAETRNEIYKEDTNISLVPTPENTYLVSPRKLRKFYMVVKKIKLAFYKLFVTIPKLLSGSLGENNNNN